MDSDHQSHQALEDISGVEDATKRQSKYQEFILRAIQNEDIESCKSYVDHVLSESVPLVMSRALITNLSECMPSLPKELQQVLSQFVIERIQPRAVSYEEPLMKMCEYLSELFQQQEEWSEAANTLARIDLESGMRVVDSGYKLGKYVKIAALYLEDGNITLADMYIKKASSLLTTTNDQSLIFQYQSCYARILDTKRKFTEASARYYDLSTFESTIDSQERLQALELSIKCAILAAAGPQRSRLLSTLYKDERSALTPLYSILEKVFLERLLSSEDVEAFSKSLSKNHVDTEAADGSTALDMAVIQHNLEACSKLYSNIYRSIIWDLLHISRDRTQDIVATMIGETITS
eukprot:jgi/Picre1/28918/NNA_004314.t1